MEGEQSIPTSSSGLTNDGVPRARHLQGRTSGPTRRSTKGQWTPEEDEILRKAVQKYNGKNWKKIAESFNDRTDVQCLHRWQKVLNPELVKGPWSKEEDEIIIQLVKQYGPKKWSTIAQHLQGRIGKQCRERWHNHLNPAINKEAWTQEEELILIRAHQIYGNKWAELTKYLPGRTDNSIKNHWNSSVKKKLDSYLASGLLSNLPPLPLSYQPIPSLSQRDQASGDCNGLKGAEIEEMSECSQESAMVTCSRSASASGILQARDEMQLTEDPGLGKEQSFSGTPCSEQFHSLEDVDLSISEIPYEVGCSSMYLAHNFTNGAGPSVSSNCQFDLHQSPNISSLQLGVEPSGFPNHSTDCDRNIEGTAVPFNACVGLNSSNIMENLVVSTGKLEKMPTTDADCCKVLFPDAVDDESFPDANNIPEDTNLFDQGQGSNPLLCQPSHIRTSESCPSNSNAQGSCDQLFLPGPSVFENIDSTLLYGGESNHLYENQEQGSITAAHDGFIDIAESASSPCGNGADGTSMQEQLLVIGDPPKLVPANSFGSGSADLQACSSKDVRLDVHIEQQDAGALCYEPPHFPSLDIPFFSCDLIQSDSNMQQDFSPLGIRQLMSSVNCISPFRLWDSPSRNDSPDAALRSAAKTFTGTPSILKKRNRDMLSPLSDRRIDKKLASDLTADLTKDFSRLDVLINENMPCSAPILKTPSNLKRNSGTNKEEKENSGHAFEGEKDKNKDGSASLFSDNLLEKKSDNNDFHNWKEQETADLKGKSKVCFNADNPTVQQPSGVLVERNANDMKLSPDQDRYNSDKHLIPGTLKNQHSLISESSQRQSIYLPGTASGNQGLTGVCSPKSSKKEKDRVTSINTIFSAPLEIFVDDIGKDTGFDYLSIFGNTPFKRSIESPSAWKSPWLCNSLLSSPNITIEDFGFSMSPGDRTYDAIGLMKQVSEHTAAAYAEALEVLGNETPESLSKERRGASQSQKQKDNSHNQSGTCSNLSPKFMTECRALDFSECETPKKGVETPGKRTDNGKPSASVSVTSPSSYLLKSCR